MSLAAVCKTRITHCPACGNAIKRVDLHPRHALRRYRVCADCGARYTAGPCSRKRLVPLVILVFAVLALNAAAAFVGADWLVLAVVSNFVLLFYVAYAVSKVTWVTYQEKP